MRAKRAPRTEKPASVKSTRIDRRERQYTSTAHSRARILASFDDIEVPYLTQSGIMKATGINSSTVSNQCKRMCEAGDLVELSRESTEVYPSLFPYNCQFLYRLPREEVVEEVTQSPKPEVQQDLCLDVVDKTTDLSEVDDLTMRFKIKMESAFGAMLEAYSAMEAVVSAAKKEQK